MIRFILIEGQKINLINRVDLSKIYHVKFNFVSLDTNKILIKKVIIRYVSLTLLTASSCFNKAIARCTIVMGLVLIPDKSLLQRFHLARVSIWSM